jgi:hypothetical protein
MIYNEHKIFEEYVNRYGSVFGACNAIAFKARKRAEATDNLVMHSEAISWVLSDVEPLIIQDFAQTRRKYCSSVCISVTQSVLDLVNDTEVKDAVEASIKESRRKKHLLYIYKDISDIYKQGRVRVLCNIIWDKLQCM